MAGFGARKGSSWAAARARFEKAGANSEERQFLALQRAALAAEREIKLGVAKGSPGGKTFKPLSRMTLLLKGSEKPLFDDGDLLGSIKAGKVDRQRKSVFVGVHRNEGSRKLNLAMIHEFGTKPYVIPVTDRMRSFFWALYYATNGAINPISPNKTVIMHPGVPARPFIRPVLETIGPKLQAEINKVMLSNGGPL